MAAEQRDRMGFLHEPFGHFRESVALQDRKSERIALVIDKRANKCVCTFAHQAGVGSKHQDDWLVGIRVRHKSFDFGGLERDHGYFCSGFAAAQVPATK